MTADPSVLDRIFERLVRTLSAGGPDQLSASFTVSEVVQALVPYRTYRGELGVDTLQDYEHAVLEMLAGERGLLVVDPDTVTAIRRELSSPDPDTGLLRRLGAVEVRLGAIRMPVRDDVRSPVARPDEDRRDTPHDGRMVSDAIAIGALIDQGDAPRADAVQHPIVSSSSTVTLPPVANPASPVSHEPPASTPLQSVQGVTIAPAAILSRITPLASSAVYGDPIDFRGMRYAPVDIGGVIFLFGMVARELGFHVESMSSGFPRCEATRQLAPNKWAKLRIEFELDSRDFRDAGRNPSACDVIVCWRDSWTERPAMLDVLSLQRMLPTLPSRE
ncbi:MAG TPA: hypothetical protein VE861_08225 [Gemmatimonadaceae bacterium]|nr:hypothetical protein [Gemmatimonadaceae bacterium]